MRKVAVAHSLAWIRAAFSHVGAHPQVFLSMGLILVALSTVPLLGGLAMLVIGPALTGGMVQAARDSAQGRSPRVGQLLHVFRDGQPLGSYIALCLPLVAAFVALIVFAIPLVMYGLHIGVLTEKMTSDPKAMQSAIPALLFGHPGGMVYVLVVCVLLLVVGMSTFLAVPAILLKRCGAWDAIKLSLAACARNFGAFLVTMLFIYVGWELLFRLLSLALPDLVALALIRVPYYALLGPLSYAMFTDIFNERETDGDAGPAPAPSPASHTFEA